jgi:RHS repeat-associated protein
MGDHSHVVGMNNRLLSDGVWNYTYDAEGNTVAKVRISDGETWSYGWDHRNQMVSVERRASDGTLLMRAEYDYDAFGNRIEKRVDSAESGTDGLDVETGLQYNRARYYDSSNGRWFSLDPLGFAAGDANLYRYVGNQLPTATDPSGYLADYVAGGLDWLTGWYSTSVPFSPTFGYRPNDA